MMKRINSFIAILAAAAGFVSCSKEEANNPDIPDDFVSVIHACTDDVASKTALGGGYSVVWSEGDQIVLSDLTNNFTFKLKEGVGTTSGTFERVGSVQSGVYNAYYPDTYDGVTWPATQIYVKNGDARENMITDAPMSAALVTVSDEGEISDVTFENVGGILQLSVTGKESIKSISFEAEGVGGVTLDCGEGVALDKTIPTKFNIALKGGVYESVVITFVSTYGAKIEKKASSFMVKTGKIYPTPMGEIVFPASLNAVSDKSEVSTESPMEINYKQVRLYGKVFYTGPEADWSSITYGVAYTDSDAYTEASQIYEHGQKEEHKGINSFPYNYEIGLRGLKAETNYKWIAYARMTDKDGIQHTSFGEVKEFTTLRMFIHVGGGMQEMGSFSGRFEGEITFYSEPTVTSGFTAYLLIAAGSKTAAELEQTTPISLTVRPMSKVYDRWEVPISGMIEGLDPATSYSYMAVGKLPDDTLIKSVVYGCYTNELNLKLNVSVLTANPVTQMEVKADLDQTNMNYLTKEYLKSHRPQFVFALTGKKGYSDAKGLIEMAGIKKSERIAANEGMSASYTFNELDYGLMNHFAASVSIDEHTYYSDIKDIQLALPNGCVDLGSGSSVYWRDRNLGATETANGTDGTRARGDYYMWGETDWRHTGDWSSDYFKDDHYFGWGTGHYKWQKEVDKNYVTKYILKAHDGDSPVDGKAYLDLEDDAARHQLGYPWRMPRESECQQLDKKDNFDIIRHGDEDYNKQYYTIKSKSNGNSITFQTSGQYHLGKELDGKGAAQMWTADLSREVDGNYQAICFMVESVARGPFLVEEVVTTDSRDRVDGYGIRPVCSKITSANY